MEVLPGGYGVAIGPSVETGKAEAKARKVKYPQQNFTDPPRTFLSNIDQGQNRSGGPLYDRTAVFVLTINPKTKNQPGKGWEVILCRKAMGAAGGHKSEKDQVGFLTRRGTTTTAGASGTNPKYWGTWGSFGGTNDRTAKSNLQAGLMEVRDEGAMGRDVTSKFRMLHSFEMNKTMIYIAYCPWSKMSRIPHLDKGQDDGSRLALLRSSHGEIAEIRKVPVDDVLRQGVLGNGLSGYALKSFEDVVLPFVNVLRS